MAGSLDGAVGIATVGSSFYDEDLKVFLTIQQGSTVFEIGDQFTFEVDNGTDLNQENIDEYDELPQKNFGAGALGTYAGDHNLRYSDSDLYAYLLLQGLRLLAKTAGVAGDDVSLELVDGGTAGAEVATATVNAISVEIEAGVTTLAQVKAAIEADTGSNLLVDVTVAGSDSDKAYATLGAVSLYGGANKTYSFNHNELTDSGPFVEGNANTRVQDLIARGGLIINKSSFFYGTLALGDTEGSNLSGPAIGNAQRFLNVLRMLNYLTVNTVGNSYVQWTGTDFECATDIQITMRDGTTVNTIDMASPIVLADGESAYVYLNPQGSVTLAVEIATSVPTDVNVFRLCTRVGNNLTLFNSTVMIPDETARIGSDGSSSDNVVNSPVRRDNAGDFEAHNGTFNKVIVAPGSGKGLDVSSAGDMYIGASVGANSMKLGASNSTVEILGDLIVQGNTTTLNTSTLDVEDKNITVNKGGNDASSEGAGLYVDRTSTKGSLIYAAAATSKFKIGDLASEAEVATISHTQAFTNKTLAVGSNHITATTGKAAQFNVSTGDLEASGVTTTELGYVSGVTSGIQAQLNAKFATASYRAGTVSLTLADTSKVVTFSSTLGTTGYRVTAQLVNTTDGSPQFVPLTITAKSATGFTVSWNAGVDSGNYSISYIAIIDN